MTVKALQVLIWGLKYILILVNRQINKYESLNDEERYQFELIAANYFPTLVLVSGEGNGNALQYSWLENPVDGRAWWAAVHRVTESDMTEVI